MIKFFFVSRPRLLVWSLLLCFNFAAISSFAQPTSAPEEQVGALPSAPTPAQTSTQSGPGEQVATAGNISGTVLDSNGGVVQNANVTLDGPGGSRTVLSGGDGQFQFPNLPPGTYKLTVSAEGMRSYTSSGIQLQSGEFHIAPAVTLAVSGVVSSVVVSGDKEELAEQQVRIAEGQRVAGIIPNFYSAYDWDAPPMLAKQKFKLSFRSLIDPVSIVTVAGIAGAEQYKGLFPGYGPGIEWFGKRFGGP